MTTEQLGEHPSPRPRADLSASFGPPNRASGLRGRLAQAPRPVTAPTSPLSAPAADTPAHPLPVTSAAEKAAVEKAPPQPEPTSQGAEPEAPILALPNQPAPWLARPQNRARTADPRRVDAEGDTATTIVYLPAEVLQRLRQARLCSGQTYTELVLDALDATHTRLADLLAAANRPQARPAGSLFAGALRSAPATAQPKAQITLRPRASDAEIIDALVRNHGTNRSKLVTVALSAHLPEA